jgi:V8-like Glu-specific endopeptidase
VAAAEGRVVVDDHPEGAAFLVGPGVALTARHVIKTALDENDRGVEEQRNSH